MFNKILPVLFLSFQLFAQNEYRDAVIATVGQEVITASDINKLTAYREREIINSANISNEEKMKIITDLRIEAMDSLIERELVFQEFKANENFNVSDNIIMEEINYFIEQNCSGNREKYLQYLSSRKITEKEHRKEVEKSIAIRMLLSQEVYRHVNVNDEEITNFFNKNQNMFKKEATLQLAIIYLADEGKNKTKGIEATIKEIQTKIANKEDFISLVKEYSDDEVSVEHDGDLGVLPTSSIEDIFIENTKNLKKDEVSAPFKYGEGTVFLKVINRVESSLTLNNDMKSEIKNILFRQKSNKRRYEYLNQLTRRVFVQIYEVKGSKIRSSNQIIRKEKTQEKK